MVPSSTNMASVRLVSAPLPSFFGPYRVVGVLGRGGMGVVYSVEHRETGERAALKTVRVPDETMLASIRREIHALSRIRHPGIARIVNEGLLEGLPWYAMELYEGETLRGHVDRVWTRETGCRSTVRSTRTAAGPSAVQPTALATTDAALPTMGAGTLPIEDADDLASVVFVRPEVTLSAIEPLLARIAGLCNALAYLHGEGLVHRDLKPENVFIRSDGRPVLVDLGIACSFGGREEIAAEGRVMGSVAYMAPEQIRGELVDARADLYALGCMLYECLTGRTPFAGGSAQAVLYQHLSELPSPPSRHVDGIPHALDALVLRLLEKRPEDRIGYAEDVAEALAALGARAPETTGAPRPRAYLYRPGLEGRAEVLAQLAEALGRAADRREGRVVFLGGESGVGKTRLCVELARRAVQRGMVVVTGQCVAVGAGVASAPFHPLRPLLVAVADRIRGAEAGEATRLLGEEGKLLAAYEPALAALAWVKGQPDLPPLPPEAARKRVLDALCRAILVFSAATPTLLVLDDLQWADELSLGVLREIVARGIGGEALLIIGTYRMEELGDELSAVVRAEGARDIALARLDPESVGAMVSGMLALRAPPRDLIEFLAAQSDGNPFFVAEYLRAAIGEGLLGRDRLGRWHLYEKTGGRDALAASVPLPLTVAQLVERRLLALGEEGRRLVEWAAVLGREVEEALLETTAGLPDEAWLGALEELRVRQVLEEATPGRLRFVHDKIRENAYAWIDVNRRPALHRRAAEVIEARFAEAPDRLLDLGHHFAQAGVHDKAAHYFSRGAERARASYANEGATGLYRAALAALNAADEGGERLSAPAREELGEGLGDVLMLVGRQDEARAAFETALAWTPEGERLRRARLHRKTGKAWETHHHHQAALAAYAAAELALGEAPSDPSQATEHEPTMAWWQEWVQIQNDRVYVHYWLAQIDEMKVVIERLRVVVEAHGNPLQRAHFYDDLVHLDLRRDRYRVAADTVDYARAAKVAAFQANDTGKACYAWFMLALVLLCHDELAEAEEEMQGALDEATRVGDIPLQVRCHTYMTVIHRRSGNLAQTRWWAARSLAVARAMQMVDYEGVAAANLAWVALSEGDVDEAEKGGEAALSAWRGLALVYPLQWLAHMPLANVCRARGRIGEAVDHVRAALDDTQQRMPEELAAGIRGAVASWERGSREETSEGLVAVERLARQVGFS
jgi:serine/threonine protein kinase